MAHRDLADNMTGLSLTPRQSSAVGACPRPRQCRYRGQPSDRNLHPDPSSHSGGRGWVLPPSPVPFAHIPDDEWVIVSHSDGIESSLASTEAAAADAESSNIIGTTAAGMAVTTGVEAATARPSTAIHGLARAAPRPPPSRDDYYQPRGDDYYQPRGDDYYQPRGDDYYQPRGDDYYQPRGDDYYQPLGDDYQPLTAALLDEFNRRIAMEAKYKAQQERIRNNANMAPSRWDHFGDGPSRAATDTLDDDWVVPPSPPGYYVFGVGGRFLPDGAPGSLIVEPDLDLEQA